MARTKAATLSFQASLGLPSNGQSEALRFEAGQRLVLRDADFKGLQDTLLITGTAHVADGGAAIDAAGD